MAQDNLAQQIVSVLQNQSPLKARAIAKQLGVDISAVNSELYGRLFALTAKNGLHEWALREPAANSSTVAKAEIESKPPKPRFSIRTASSDTREES